MATKYVKTGHLWHKTTGDIVDGKSFMTLYKAKCGQNVACTINNQEPLDTVTDEEPMCPLCAANKSIPEGMLRQ